MENVAAPADEHVNHAYTANKDALLKRLRRIEGQVRGVTRIHATIDLADLTTLDGSTLTVFAAGSKDAFSLAW